jgi:hypothetical protein
MAGVRGRNVDAVHGRDRVPLRRHLAGGQSRPRVQPEAGGGARRRQGPQGLLRVLRRVVQRAVPLHGVGDRGEDEVHEGGGEESEVHEAGRRGAPPTRPPTPYRLFGWR